MFYDWMKHPMENATSLQDYEVVINKLIFNLTLFITVLFSVYDLLFAPTLTIGLSLARYTMLAAIATLLIKILPIQLPIPYRSLLLVSTLTLLILMPVATDHFSLLNHYLLFAMIFAVAMYFHTGILVAYGIFLNLVLILVGAMYPARILGPEENFRNAFAIFFLLNGIFLLLFYVMQWVRFVLNETLHNSDRLTHITVSDSLADVPNRAHLIAHLTNDILIAENQNTLLAVAAMDIDNFKELNNLFGRQAGDLFLAKIAERIQLFTRSTDIVARMDGDEFAIVLTGLREPADAIIQMNRIIDNLSIPHPFQKQRIKINVSIGLAFYPRDGTDSKTLMIAANEAMFSAKRNGKNCLRIFGELSNP